MIDTTIKRVIEKYKSDVREDITDIFEEVFGSPEDVLDWTQI